jgi:hypothetical protein
MMSKEDISVEELYSLLDVRCEHCGEKIMVEPDILYIDDPDSDTGERAAYFCDDFCSHAWFNEPADNPCNAVEED